MVRHPLTDKGIVQFLGLGGRSRGDGCGGAEEGSRQGLRPRAARRGADHELANSDERALTVRSDRGFTSPGRFADARSSVHWQLAAGAPGCQPGGGLGGARALDPCAAPHHPANERWSPSSTRSARGPLARSAAIIGPSIVDGFPLAGRRGPRSMVRPTRPGSAPLCPPRSPSRRGCRPGEGARPRRSRTRLADSRAVVACRRWVASLIKSSRSTGFVRMIIGQRAGSTWTPSAISSTWTASSSSAPTRKSGRAMVDARHRVEQVRRRCGPGGVTGARLVERRGRVPERDPHPAIDQAPIRSRLPASSGAIVISRSPPRSGSRSSAATSRALAGAPGRGRPAGPRPGTDPRG